VARGNIPDPEALGTGSGEKGMEGEQGGLAKRGPGTWPSTPSWFAPSPWRNMSRLSLVENGK